MIIMDLPITRVKNKNNILEMILLDDTGNVIFGELCAWSVGNK